MACSLESPDRGVDLTLLPGHALVVMNGLVIDEIGHGRLHGLECLLSAVEVLADRGDVGMGASVGEDFAVRGNQELAGDDHPGNGRAQLFAPGAQDIWGCEAAKESGQLRCADATSAGLETRRIGPATTRERWIGSGVARSATSVVANQVAFLAHYWIRAAPPRR